MVNHRLTLRSYRAGHGQGPTSTEVSSFQRKLNGADNNCWGKDGDSKNPEPGDRSSEEGHFRARCYFNPARRFSSEGRATEPRSEHSCSFLSLIKYGGGYMASARFCLVNFLTIMSRFSRDR